MRAIIEPRHFRDPDIWKREIETIFNRCWLFAGHAQDIPNDGDWFVVQLGPQSVVIQNCGDQFRSFLNVCSHRGARLCAEAKGSGNLQCPYHGWQYDREGTPRIIPKKPRFPELDERLLQELSLTQYEVETCGNLIFVRKAAEGKSLRDYLGAMHPVLEKISLSLGKTVDTSEKLVAANWKVNIENSLEGYHVGFVHKETFVKMGVRETGFEFHGLHSMVSAEFSEKLNTTWRNLQSRIQTSYEQEGYSHWFIFPNLLVAGSYGLSFTFSTFAPTSPVSSTFKSRIFQVRPGGPGNMALLLDSFMDSIKEFNGRVFEEDAEICELVQVGIAEATAPGILSDEEERVCSFQKSYLAFLSVAGSV